MIERDTKTKTNVGIVLMFVGLLWLMPLFSGVLRWDLEFLGSRRDCWRSSQ